MIPELLFCPGVQQDNLPVLIDHYHSIRSGLKKPPIPSLHLGEVLFGILADGDIADGGGDEDALRAFERAEHDFDGEAGSIPAQADQLDAGADLLGEGLGGGAGAIGDKPLGEALGDDVGDLLAEQLVAAVAELLFRLGVEQDDLSLLIDDDHAIGRGFEQAAVTGFRLAVLAEVAADLGESTQITDRVAERDVGGAGEELGAVLAYAHSIFFVASAGGSQAEHLFRAASLDIFPDKKLGEVVADDFFGFVSLDMLGAGAPTEDLAARIEHEDGVVLHSVKEGAVSFFALLQRFLGAAAFVTVADRGPGGDAGDQYSQQGAEEEDDFGLGEVAVGFSSTQHQQALFLVLQRGHQRAKLGVLLVGIDSNGGHRRIQALVAAHIDHGIGVGDSFPGQHFKVGKVDLLDGVVGGEGANGGLIQGDPGDAGPVGVQVGVVAREREFAAAGLDAFHGQSQILDALDDQVGMPHPPGALVGDDHHAIGERPHQHQGEHGETEGEPHFCVQEGLHHFST